MAGYLAGQMLHSYGHRDIGFVYVMDNEYYRSVEQGFFRAGLELGARCRAGFKAPNREAEIEIARVIAQDKELTGLVVVGDQFSGRIIQDLERLGVCVPNDKSILSIGGLPRHILQEPNLARIKGSGELMGQEAAQILLSENAKVVHKFLPVAFEPGRTLKIVNGYLQSV
jgi:DNA-binding LacI/PurR family transcriptional regulator